MRNSKLAIINGTHSYLILSSYHQFQSFSSPHGKVCQYHQQRDRRETKIEKRGVCLWQNLMLFKEEVPIGPHMEQNVLKSEQKSLLTNDGRLFLKMPILCIYMPNNYIKRQGRMSYKSQGHSNAWQQSKHLFFTPKLSLQGKNLFPQIADINSLHANKQTPFLNILKKPIMSLYDKSQLRQQRKPVCVVGLSKDVESRSVKTGQLRRSRKGQLPLTEDKSAALSREPFKESIISYSPVLLKSELTVEYTKSPSKKSLPPQGLRFYLVGPGNNSKLIEEIIARREGWHPTRNSIFHFRWQQIRPKFHNITAPHRQVINHLPNHEILSDKNKLLQILKNYCDKHNETLFRILPASFSLDFNSHDTIENEMKKFVQFMWECNNHQPKEENDEMIMLRSSIKVSDGEELCDSPKKSPKKETRPGLMRSNRKIQQSPQDKKRQQIRGLYKTLISILRPVYHFQDMSSLKRDNPLLLPEVASTYGDSSLWLFKPSDLNRGRGIKLFRNIQEIGDLLLQELTRNEKGSFICQKYIERPMLIEGRKFDIRVWAMVSHLQEIFFFKQGYIRLSSEKFNLDTRSLFTHLTNNAVQKQCANYGQFEEGNILPLNYLEKQGLIEMSDLQGQMRRLVDVTMRAAGNKLHTPGQHQSIQIASQPEKQYKSNQANPSKTKYFEIFGYDFMIDQNKHVWLIEVNTNPSLEMQSSWLQAIMPRMVDDAMKITLDRIFYRKSVLKTNSIPLTVPGHDDNLNMWQPLDCSNPQQSIGMSV